MTKKAKVLLALLGIVALLSIPAQAQTVKGTRIIFTTYYNGPGDSDGGGNAGSSFNPRPRTPVSQPVVSIDTYVLYFYDVSAMTLEVVDGSGDVVFTSTIPSGTSTCRLPYTLSGDYEIRLTQGNYCFVGEITL